MRRLSHDATQRRLDKLGLERVPARGYALIDDVDQLAYALHTHSRHQLLYALEGTVRLETEDATYVLPPQRAAFIPAGVRHLTVVEHVRITSIFLDRTLVPAAPESVRVIAVTPLLRELVAYAGRWPPAHDANDPTAEAFFRCLGLLCADWLKQPLAARLPRGRSREVRRLVEYVLSDVAHASLTRAAQVVGASERTLRRRLHDELGTSFRELVTHARLMRALELLSEPHQRVTDVAYAVGYESLSAFAKSFAQFAGESPSAYRARIRAGANK